MPFTIELTEQEVLRDPTGALFRCNTMIHKFRNELHTKVKGRCIGAGEFKGVVTSMDSAHVSIKNDSGVQKSLALTPARITQLLAETQRK